MRYAFEHDYITSCQDCPIQQEEFGWCSLDEFNTIECTYLGKGRPANCPLVTETNRGTCNVRKNTDDYGWYCECGNFFPPSVPPQKYCPKCGKRIERKTNE